MLHIAMINISARRIAKRRQSGSLFASLVQLIRQRGIVLYYDLI
jgi:hypothetical protein